MRTILTIAALLSVASGILSGQTLGTHQARYSGSGELLPWSPWRNILDKEMQWYERCPIEHGYPRFVWMTFMNGDYTPKEERPDFIPATQDGMGIISYIKYYRWRGRPNTHLLEIARQMGDFLLRECSTPDSGAYPLFVRSTGTRGRFPQSADCGSQGDRPFEIQPDKGGIVGYAFALLYEETKEEDYLQRALHLARVLARNMKTGTAEQSPWPFRADYRTGASRGSISGNMAYILRLFDWMISHGHSEFAGARAPLWNWIKRYQIPSASGDGHLWEQFFEDHDESGNRTAWAPLDLARYLLERRDTLDSEWQSDARTLISFVNNTFVTVQNGVAVCGEQDHDHQPWGGILSTWGAVLAMYSSAVHSTEYTLLARQALTYCLYAVDVDGCPRDLVLSDRRGGWQEDAHTDKIHNFVDAMEAFPELGK